MFKTLTTEDFTDNGMIAHKTSGNKVFDFFTRAPAMRRENQKNPKQITSMFFDAIKEDEELAIRALLWLRDCRGGAGERNTFRILLKELEKYRPDILDLIIPKTPELGRWDDILSVRLNKKTANFIRNAIERGNNLAAKWMPREDKDPEVARELMKFWGMSPKQYRKFLSTHTTVVETLMCMRRWGSIVYKSVPSNAMSNYHKAFMRHDPKRFQTYINDLSSGKTTINVSVLYPYDVVRVLRSNPQLAQAQWDALPDFLSKNSVLPMLDSSGSMNSPSPVQGLSLLNIASSLAVYCAERNTPNFKDLILTFSERPVFVQLRGSIRDKLYQAEHSQWAMNTNIEIAARRVAELASKNNLPQEELPKVLLILSDMQFDSCVTGRNRAVTMFNQVFAEHGYEPPVIIYWDLRGTTIHVRHDTRGQVQVSGFSPNIVRPILQNSEIKNITPRDAMVMTLSNNRYRWR